MKIFANKIRPILRIIEADTKSFATLMRISELDPSEDLRGANLQGVDFGEDDLTGYDFAHADLRSAKLSRATGLGPEMFVGANIDHTTELADDLRSALRQFNVEIEARRMVLEGQSPPSAWVRYIRRLDFKGTTLASVALLEDLKRLQRLDLDGTLIEDLSPLSELRELTVISLNRTPIIDVSPLAALPKLSELWLDDTKVMDVSCLASVKTLKVLSLNNSPVIDLTPLTTLETLAVRMTGDAFRLVDKAATKRQNKQ